MAIIDTIILAGGKSSRMGKDKALLTIHNQPFLTKICAITLEVSQNVYIVTSFPERYQNIVPKSCEIIREENPFQGPLFAFYQSLNYVESSWILLLACDVPLLSLKEIKIWLNQLEKLPSNITAFLPKNNKGWDCLCGFYHLGCLTSLEVYLKGNNYSFQGWLNQQSVAEININNKQVLFNCNTPEDYQKILEIAKE